MKAFLVVVLLLLTFDAHAQMVEEWNDEVKLWSARSVLGEVGWDRPGEWGAVLWVYYTRARTTKRYTFYQMVRQYSAAVKSGNHHRNPWLFNLSLDRTYPCGWPMKNGSGPRWSGLHDASWLRTLEFVDLWQSGKVSNSCKRANHFGGDIDRHRAESLGWKRIKCNEEGHRRFRNRFYDSTHTQAARPHKRPMGF